MTVTDKHTRPPEEGRETTQVAPGTWDHCPEVCSPPVNGLGRGVEEGHGNHLNQTACKEPL